MDVRLHEFWQYREELHIIDGVVLKGSRIVVPESLQNTILSKIIDGQMGIEKSRARARNVVFWPGMSKAIENKIQEDEVRNKFGRSNAHEPLISHEVPQRPWQCLASDLFEFKGISYIIIVDYFSKFPEVFKIRDKSTESVKNALVEVFTRHGIPEKLVSDNVPYDSDDMKKFASEWGFIIEPSSLRYPRSNGQSERMVQTIKNLMKLS